MAKTQRTSSQKTRLLTSGLVAVVAVLIASGVRMGLAQTSTFVEPTCDPTKNANCNLSAPIFSNSNTAQTITSDLTISGNKTLTTNGPIKLQTGSQILTDTGGITGITLNVQSTNNYAISAKSGTTAAIFATGLSGADGLLATTSDGKAVHGQVTGTGYAGFFEGNVSISGVLTVGGKNITGGASQAVNLITNVGATAPNNIASWSLLNDASVFNGAHYMTASVSAMFRPAGNFGTAWKNVTGSDISYAECNGTAFAGTVNITNTTGAAADYRIMVNYTNTVVDCGDAVPPTPGTMTGVNNSFWYTGSVTLGVSGASDNTGVAKVEYYYISSAAPSTSVIIGTATSGSGFPFSWNTVGMTNSYPSNTPTYSVYAKVYDAAGNVASTPQKTGILITNGQGYQPCNTPSASTVCGGTNYFCCTNTQQCVGGLTKPYSPPGCMASASTCGPCNTGSALPDAGPGA